MGRRLLVLAAALAVALVLPNSPVGAQEVGRPLSSTLTGAAEVPGPGDAEGLATVCFDVSWEDIDGTVFASHIHVGPAGVAGPVVVTLFTGTFSGTDAVSGCASGVDRGLIKAIRQDPSAYYVNVHGTLFPAGAARGQLGK